MSGGHPIRRPGLLVLTAALIVPTLVAPTASAGGSWLEVRGVDGVGGGSGSWDGWAAPGAVVTMGGEFCDGQGVSPGSASWAAYLRPDGAPPRQRLELAPVTMSDAAGNGCEHLATTSFAVPAVAPGLYWVDVCSDATCSIGAGDLIGGSLTVAATPLEATLLRENAEQVALLEEARRDRRRVRTDIGRLEGVITDLEDRLDEALDEVGERGASAADPRGELRALEAALHAARADASRSRLATLALALVLVVGAVALGTSVIAGRRRRRRPVIPDSPAELFADVPSPTPGRS